MTPVRAPVCAVSSLELEVGLVLAGVVTTAKTSISWERMMSRVSNKHLH